jgi:starvation-inducible DNA-binding protein
MAVVKPLAPSQEPVGTIDIGVEATDRQRIAEALGPVLADTYTLLAKTHGFHWNVTGPQFPALHELFEQLYTDLFEAVDDIAERMRAVGVYAPTSLTAFADLSTLPEVREVPDAETMLRLLIADNEAIARQARQVAELAQGADDGASEDLMNARMAAHDKAAWMLRATLAA